MSTVFSKVKLKGRQIALLSVLVLLAAVAEMMLPSLLAQMINSGVADFSRSTILILAAVMAGVTVLACVVNFWSVKIASRISTDFSATLRGQVFKKVQSFSAAELDKFGTASLVTRSTSDITNVQNFLTLLLRIGILAPMMAIAGLIFSAATGGQVSSVLTVAIPVLLVGCGIVILFASRYSVKLRKKLDRLNQLFLESLEGVRVIRAFNKQQAESRRFGEANADYAAIAMLSSRITSLLLPLINVIFGVTTAAVLGLGAYYVETIQIDLDIGSDKESNYQPFAIYKEQVLDLLAGTNMTQSKKEDLIIALFAYVQGLTAFATMKNVHYSLKWEDKLADLIGIFGCEF